MALTDDPHRIALIDEDRAAWHRHVVAAITEGLCPGHRQPLIPEPRLPSGPGGYCTTCRQWIFLSDHDAPDGPFITVDLAYDPYDGQPIEHPWMRGE